MPWNARTPTVWTHSAAIDAGMCEASCAPPGESVLLASFPPRYMTGLKAAQWSEDAARPGKRSKRPLLAETGPKPAGVQASATADSRIDDRTKDGTDRLACASGVYSWLPRTTQAWTRPLLRLTCTHSARGRMIHGLGTMAKNLAEGPTAVRWGIKSSSTWL